MPGLKVLNEEDRDGVAYFELEGMLDAHNFETLETLFEKHFDKGLYRFVIDIKRLTYVSSALRAPRGLPDLPRGSRTGSGPGSLHEEGGLTFPGHEATSCVKLTGSQTGEQGTGNREWRGSFVS